MNIIKNRIKEQEKILNMCYMKKNEHVIQLLDSKKRSKKSIIYIHLIPLITILLFVSSTAIVYYTFTVTIPLLIYTFDMFLFMYYVCISSTPLTELFKLNVKELQLVSKYLNIIVTSEILENFDIIEFEYAKAEEPLGFYFMTFDNEMHFCECKKHVEINQIKQILKITHYSNCLRETKIEYECM